MVNINELELYKQVIEKWGCPAQIRKAIEECGELIVALAKHENNMSSSTVNDVLEEMVDTEIMIEQLKLIFNYNFQLTPPYSKFHVIKKQKLERLKRRLEV